MIDGNILQTAQRSFDLKRSLNSEIGGKGSQFTGACLFFREAGFTNIAQRLIEVQFELTDRLTYYLCGRRPGT